MMTSTGMYDVIVFGAGIEGSSTARYLAKCGQKTLLLEQFPVPHTRGSSHGPSRIIRYGYAEEHYARMMKEAYHEWFEIEKETNTSLYVKCGCLNVAKTGRPYLDDVKRNLELYGMGCEVFNSVELKRRFPAMNFPSDYAGIFDPEGGVLRADKALRATQDLFKQYGGDLRDSHQVTSLNPTKEMVIVTTNNGEFRGRSVVICAGPWAPKVLSFLDLVLPIKPVRTTTNYWEEKIPGSHGPDVFPTFIDKESESYGLPSLEYPGLVKIPYSHVKYGISERQNDPDTRDQGDCTPGFAEHAIEYIEQTFPGLKTPAAIVETCMYSMTPDEDFILDRHPQYENVVMGLGFSGSGFKLAPVVGKILGNLAMGKAPNYDLAPFSISRFDNKKN